MTIPTLRLGVLAGAFFALAVAWMPDAAWAVTDCRTVQSVKDSAALSQNETDGGHVAKHVIGVDAPDGWPRRLNTTAFKSESDFDDVWTNYLAADLPDRKIADCTGTSGAIDKSASVGDLDMSDLKLDKCTGVDGDNNCNAWTEGDVRNVSFTFRYTGGKWILYSSFPME